MKATYYLEIFSSWCHFAEPAWAQLKSAYAGRAEFEWKIALMDTGDFPRTGEALDWRYRRSCSTVMGLPYMLNSGWVGPNQDYRVPNLVAEAARSLGAKDDRVRLALAEAALRRGEKIAHWDKAVAIASQAGGLNAKDLLAAARSETIAAAISASTAEMKSHGGKRRPTFFLESGIEDKAVLSGIVRYEPLAAAIDAMLLDESAYLRHEAQFGKPPA